MKIELAKLYGITWNEFNINGGLQQNVGLARLYLPRKEGGRKLISVEDYVAFAKVAIISYLSNSKEGL